MKHLILLEGIDESMLIGRLCPRGLSVFVFCV